MTAISSLWTAFQHSAADSSHSKAGQMGCKPTSLISVTGLLESNNTLLGLYKCLLFLLIQTFTQNSYLVQVAAPPAIVSLLPKPQSILWQPGNQLKRGGLGRKFYALCGGDPLEAEDKPRCEAAPGIPGMAGKVLPGLGPWRPAAFCSQLQSWPSWEGSCVSYLGYKSMLPEVK